MDKLALLLSYIQNHFNKIVNYEKIFDVNTILNKEYIDFIQKNNSLDKNFMYYVLVVHGKLNDKFLFDSLHNFCKIPFKSKENIKNFCDSNYNYLYKKGKKLGIKFDIDKYKKIMMGTALLDKNLSENSFISGNIFSISYVFDDLIDTGKLSKEQKKQIIELVSNFLESGQINYEFTKNCNIKKIVIFILEKFQLKFPFNENHQIYEMLKLLHISQFREKELSNKVVNNEANEEEWYHYIMLKAVMTRLAASSFFEKIIFDENLIDLIKVSPFIQLRNDFKDFARDIYDSSITPFNIKLLTKYMPKFDPFKIMYQNIQFLMDDLDNQNLVQEIIVPKYYEAIILHFKEKKKYKCKSVCEFDIDKKLVEYLLKLYEKDNFVNFNNFKIFNLY